MTEPITFPKDFLWGAATSSHQIEGQNVHNDWWEWEQSGGSKDPSGIACDSYRRYEEDFYLAKQLNHNSHRFSIEWSRVSPKEGKWDESAISHYLDLIKALRKREIEPIVTLHHFTNPIWVKEYGGWENSRVVDDFGDFVRKMVDALGHEVQYWVTINEPMVFLFHGYLMGCWPPGKRSVLSCIKAMLNMAKAHKRAYKIIRENNRYKKGSLFVGIARSIQYFEPHIKESLRDRLATSIRNAWSNRLFFFLIGNSMDFIGLNYYFREIIAVKPSMKGMFALIGDICREDKRYVGAEHCDLQNEIYPEGIYHILKTLKRYKVPIIVTESGLSTNDENLRKRHIHDHLAAISKAIKEGVDVIGYQYWSLLDNFEWQHGYRPHFGLISVDHETQNRTIKPSADYYAQIARTGQLLPV